MAVRNRSSQQVRPSGDSVMASFDRDLARTLLEICRYTYAAGLGDAENEPDRLDARNWLFLDSNPKPLGQPLAEPVVVRSALDRTSVACVTPYPGHNVVSYMGTETAFRQREPTPAALKAIIDSLHDWTDNAKGMTAPFTLSGPAIGDPGIASVTLPGMVHHGFLQQL